MPRRLRPADLAAVMAATARLDEATTQGAAPERDDVAMLVRHYLAVLEERAPGRSVEVRVPPYAAIQCVPGVRHTRGTPPAVVETDAATWIALARGQLTFTAAIESASVYASGERSDLSAYLPLDLLDDSAD